MLSELIRSGQWRAWVVSDNDKSDTLINVDLRRATPEHNGERFKFKWADSLGGGVTLFFPQTTFESDKVLYVDEYKVFANLDLAIFNALTRTKGQRKDLSLALCYGDYCYRIYGVDSSKYNYYVYWFDTLTRYDHDGYSKPMVHHVPCLIETDGHLNVTNIVCFNSLDIRRDTKTLDPLCLAAHKESYLPVYASMMFNCDNLSRASRSPGKNHLKTVDELTANAGVRNIVTSDICDSDVSIYLEEEDHDGERQRSIEILNP